MLLYTALKVMKFALPPHSHLLDASEKHSSSSKHILHNHSPFPTVSVVPKHATPPDIWDLPMELFKHLRVCCYRD